MSAGDKVVIDGEEKLLSSDSDASMRMYSLAALAAFTLLLAAFTLLLVAAFRSLRSSPAALLTTTRRRTSPSRTNCR